MVGVHGSEDQIIGNLSIERRNEPGESVLSDREEDLRIVHL
jgi:hypothetical protein